MNIEHALRKFPNYGHFDADELGLLATSLELQPFREGDVIVKAGTEADSLFLILEGEAEIVLRKGGKRRVVGTEAAGSLFGLNGLLRKIERSADVVAASPMQVGVLNRYAFDILYNRSLPFCELVTAQLVRDARRVSDAIAAALDAEGQGDEAVQRSHEGLALAFDSLDPT